MELHLHVSYTYGLMIIYLYEKQRENEGCGYRSADASQRLALQKGQHYHEKSGGNPAFFVFVTCVKANPTD